MNGDLTSGSNDKVQNNEISGVPLDSYLDDQMGEREAILVRLGQLEDSLIQHGRIKKRSKPPRSKGG